MSGRKINTEAVKIISRLQLLWSFDRAPLDSAREAQVLERIRAHPKVVTFHVCARVGSTVPVGSACRIPALFGRGAV